MNCIEARLLMSAAVDSELSLIEQQLFVEHLAICRECYEEFEDAKKTKLIVKQRIVHFKAPQSLLDTVMQLTCCKEIQPERSMLF